MTKIWAGTAFNQVIHFQSEDKQKKRSILGAMSREPVIEVSHSDELELTVYATSKTITSSRKENAREEVRVYGS